MTVFRLFPWVDEVVHPEEITERNTRFARLLNLTDGPPAATGESTSVWAKVDVDFGPPFGAAQAEPRTDASTVAPLAAWSEGAVGSPVQAVRSPPPSRSKAKRNPKTREWSETDEVRVRLLADVRYMTKALMLRVWWPGNVNEGNIDEWLRRMIDGGWVQLACFGDGQVKRSGRGLRLFEVTQKGARQVGASYKVTGTHAEQSRHTLAAAEIAAAYTNSGWNVVTERSIKPQARAAADAYRDAVRQAARSRRPQITVVRLRPQQGEAAWTRAGRGRETHTPDLLVERWLTGRRNRRMVEIELEPKTVSAYTDLFMGFWEAYSTGALDRVQYVLDATSAKRREIATNVLAGCARALTATQNLKLVDGLPGTDWQPLSHPAIRSAGRPPLEEWTPDDLLRIDDRRFLYDYRVGTEPGSETAQRLEYSVRAQQIRAAPALAAPCPDAHP